MKYIIGKIRNARNNIRLPDNNIDIIDTTKLISKNLDFLFPNRKRVKQNGIVNINDPKLEDVICTYPSCNPILPEESITDNQDKPGIPTELKKSNKLYTPTNKLTNINTLNNIGNNFVDVKAEQRIKYTTPQNKKILAFGIIQEILLLLKIPTKIPSKPKQIKRKKIEINIPVIRILFLSPIK